MRVVFIVIVFACLQNTQAQTGLVGEVRQMLKKEVPTVALTTYTTHQVQSDRSVVIATIKTDGRSISDALSRARSSRADLVKALEHIGITDTNIVYKPFAFHSQSGFFSKKTRNYNLESQIQIMVANEEQFARTLDVLKERSDEWVFINFEPRDSREVESKIATMEKAMDEIERKKAFFERRLKVKLIPHAFGEDVRVNRGGVGGGAGGGGGFDDTVVLDAMGNPVGSPQVESSHGSFGEIHYAVQLTVTYRMQSISQKSDSRNR